MSFTQCKPMFPPLMVSLFIILLTPLRLQGFNIDTKSVQVIPGPKDTLFGYSARFLPNPQSDELRLLVGAPSANTTAGGLRSGTLHICSDVLDPQKACDTLQYLADDLAMVNGSHHEEFGAAVAVSSSGDFMVCSPRWKDTSSAAAYITFMPGRCTLYNLELSTQEELKPYYHTGSDKRKYVVRFDAKQEYFHGLASFGFSADSDKDSVYVMGSPGVLMSEGRIWIQDEKTGEFNETKTRLENKLYTTAYGYLGYSVKLGKFCNGSDVCLAAGAPNQNRVGMVHIYKWEARKSLKLIQLIQGTQAWTYFGFALCAVDVNGDGFQELIVGAPHYTDVSDSLNGFDQGRVFVYSRTPAKEELVFSESLDGGPGKYARFGSAIETIGDINLDGYQDIAVGAPGEDGGAGSVYIYLGGLAGLTNPASQRITASQISTGLTSPIHGFGFAFSDSMTARGSKYPVFTATSVASDTIVVFKCRPIVDVTATLVAEPNPVDIEAACAQAGIKEPCFKLKFCMQYDIRGEAKQRLNFQIGFDMDVQVPTNLKRALFRTSDTKLAESIPMTKHQMQANGMCMDYTAILRESQVNRDRFKPVEIVARFELDDDKPPNMDPVLDAVKPKNVTLMVTFLNECGGDNKCEVDLGVTGEMDYTHTGQWKNIVVNHTKELMVNVKIKNSMETSYWTVIKIDVDSALPFSRSTSDVSVSCQSMQDSVAEPSDSSGQTAASSIIDKSTVTCNYYKPLEQGSSIELMVAFDTYNVDLTKKSLKIHAQAMPQNKENNPEKMPQDNSVNLTTSVAIISDVSIEGSSSPFEVTLYDAKRLPLTIDSKKLEGFQKSEKEVKLMNVTKKILVRNNGPSFLPKTTVNISVPMYIPDGTQLVHEADVKVTTPDGKVTQCRETVKFDLLSKTTTAPKTTSSSAESKTSTASSSGETTEPTDDSSTTMPTTTEDWSWLPDGPVNRRKRAIDRDNTQVLDTIYTLSCSTNVELCQVFVCDLGTNLAPNSHAEVNVSLVLDKANVPVPKDFTACYFLTKAEVTAPEHPLFVSWKHPRAKETLTKFHLVESGGKINIWIIIGSIIAGLVLITIIVIICWKLGFFKRDKHYQVERWKRESQRRSRKGYSKAPAEDNNETGAAAAAPSTPDNDL